MILVTAICFISFILLTLYAVLLHRYENIFLEIPIVSPQLVYDEKISVIIPARNEENNIGRCLDAIQQQDYPQNNKEIIVADDHSSDQTASIVISKGAKLVTINNLP